MTAMFCFFIGVVFVLVLIGWQKERRRNDEREEWEQYQREKAEQGYRDYRP